MKKRISFFLILLLFYSYPVHGEEENIKATNGNEQNYLILTKEEFKQWLMNENVTRNIKLIQHHHTWAPSYKHFHGNNHARMVKGMENHHVRTMKWKTIAQHITTFPDGKIAIGRPFNMDPEGTIGKKANSGAIMIENVGNFDKGNDVMTKEQKDTIVYVTALLSMKFRLTPSIDTITYHHWWNLKTGERVLDDGDRYSVKTCQAQAFLEEMIRKVRELTFIL